LITQILRHPFVFWITLTVNAILNFFPEIFFQVMGNGIAAVFMAGLDNPFRPDTVCKMRPVIFAFFQLISGLFQFFLPGFVLKQFP